MKRMDVQILQPNRTVEEFKAELRAALKSTVVHSETVRQQHSEEELRECFTQLLAAMEAAPAE